MLFPLVTVLLVPLEGTWVAEGMTTNANLEQGVRHPTSETWDDVSSHQMPPAVYWQMSHLVGPSERANSLNGTVWPSVTFT